MEITVVVCTMSEETENAIDFVKCTIAIYIKIRKHNGEFFINYFLLQIVFRGIKYLVAPSNAFT